MKIHEQQLVPGVLHGLKNTRHLWLWLRRWWPRKRLERHLLPWQGKTEDFFAKNNKLFGVYWKLVWFLGSLSINDHPGFSPFIQFLQWRRRWWWRWCGLRINSSAHRGCLVELMVKSSFGFFARWIQPWWLMTGYYTNPYDPYVLVLLASTTSSTSNSKFKLVGNFHNLTHPGGDPTLNHPI